MKRTILLTTLLILAASQLRAQEKYGKTLNIGAGIGYFGFTGAVPAVHANFEFDLAKNFSLAPFATFYAYRRDHWWGDAKNPPRYYTYSENVLLTGAKGTYYFDQLIGLPARWDLYAGASAGFAITASRWEDNYHGDRSVYPVSSPLFFAIHIGGEYRLTPKIGVFLDLSSGISTTGFAFHL